MLSYHDANTCNTVVACGLHIVADTVSWGLLLSRLSSFPQSLPPLPIFPCSFQKRKTTLARVAAKLTSSHDKHS